MTSQDRTPRDGPWTRRQRQPVHQGRVIAPGPKIKINWDRVHSDSTLSHSNDDIIAGYNYREGMARLRQDDIDGLLSDSKRRKVQKMVNDSIETMLALRQSWCPTCLNALHNCSCDLDFVLEDIKVMEKGVTLIHQLRQATVDKENARRLEEKLVARRAYIARKKGQA